MAQDTIDERIVKALRSKVNIANAIMDENLKDWIYDYSPHYNQSRQLSANLPKKNYNFNTNAVIIPPIPMSKAPAQPIKILSILSI